MAKLTVEDKKKIIDLYKEGYGAPTISRKINIGCARIREILRKYDLYGDAVIEYIEYYNKNRITTKLKGLSPLLYRQQSFNQLQY